MLCEVIGGGCGRRVAGRSLLDIVVLAGLEGVASDDERVASRVGPGAKRESLQAVVPWIYGHRDDESCDR